MYRIGFSKDIHKLVTDRPLILGGVNIEHTKGLLGHSDADVLLHAIAEAMLGALALGDLGTHFPDTDPLYKGMDSKVILSEVYKKIYEKGYEINNVDCMVLAERPKLKPHINTMRENISELLNTDIDNICVKATRGEGLGFIGNEEGMMAECVVMLKKI